MKPIELIILLPCHSLEDFPTHHRGEAAEGLLAAWSTLWHPALLASTLKTPTWRRVEEPLEDPAGMLIVVPTAAAHDALADWAKGVLAAGGVVIRGLYRRCEIVAKALEALADDKPAAADAELEADFLALGLAYLFTELLTRRMRYTSNLDEVRFQDHTLAAATAYASANSDAARERLQKAFEVLLEARSHFYPVDTYLLDLTLLAETTLGPELTRTLQEPVPFNLLATGEVIERLAERNGEALVLLKAAWAEKRCGIVGGEHCEGELPLWSLESMLAGLAKGHSSFERNLSKRPEVFGRRRTGLTPALPQVLRGLGYRGVLHFTLDDGRFPLVDRSKTLWEGTNYTSIDAMGRVPLDARDPASFLSLPEKLGESMDYDYVSMVAFARWPGHASEYYDDLRRMSKYAPVLGKFVTVEEFFGQSDSAGQFSKFDPDQYRAPYLAQAVAAARADPISSSVEHVAVEWALYEAEALATWAQLLSGRADARLAGQCAELRQALGSGATAKAITGRETALAAAREALLSSLPAEDTSAARGVLVVNTSAATRKIGLELPMLGSLPAIQGAVLAADDVDGVKRAVVEVPAMGFAWIGSDGADATSSSRAGKSIAYENMLVNDRIEVKISRETGGVRSIRDLAVRGNRLSQQLAYRLPGARPQPGELWRDPDESPEYAATIAESVEITSASTVYGEITSKGRIIASGERELARFTQRTGLWAGSQTVEIDLEIDPLEELGADPWQSYCACRFAWAEEDAELRRGVHLGSYRTELKRLEAPHYLEVIGAKSRTAILTGGLPYHLRSGPRMLDTLLMVRGEQARRFRLAVALEEPRPWQAALDRIRPTTVIPNAPPPRGGSIGWLFHVDQRNVVVTHWEPWTQGSAMVGFRIRCLEVAGRGGSVTLRCFREVAEARRTDLLGEPAEQLSTDGDSVRFDLGAHEWMQLEVRWA